MGAPHYTPSGKPIQGSAGSSQDLRTEFGLVETGMQVMNSIPVTLYFADANLAADDTFIVVPWDCLVKTIYVVTGSGNSIAETILTPKIATVAITGGAITIPLNALVDVVFTATPTAANAISAGQTLEIETDGGGTAVMPLVFTVLLERT